MPRPQNWFTHLAGAEVRYDRLSREAYGTRGRATRFYATAAFEEKLDDAFADLWNACPLGEAEVIASGGAFVEKPGAHGQGRAFDLDALFWPERTFVTLAYPQDRRFYLAVEAVLRMHFGTVLNYRYDPAHRDHLHLDDLTPVGFDSRRRSHVLFLQMALTHLFDRPDGAGYSVAVDGLIGPETRGAARRLLAALDLEDAPPPEQSIDERLDAVWLDLLDAAARRGFARASHGEETDEERRPDDDEGTPLVLWRHVYRTVEETLGGTAARAEIEAALHTFADHDATAGFLDRFRPSEGETLPDGGNSDGGESA